jgi:hypothetical protein
MASCREIATIGSIIFSFCLRLSFEKKNVGFQTASVTKNKNYEASSLVYNQIPVENKPPRVANIYEEEAPKSSFPTLTPATTTSPCKHFPKTKPFEKQCGTIPVLQG